MAFQVSPGVNTSEIDLTTVVPGISSVDAGFAGPARGGPADDVRLVASVHDEYQFEVANKDIGDFCAITKIAMKDTEKQLKLRCPLDNSYKVGITWEETH